MEKLINQSQRLEKILEQLEQNGQVQSHELSKQFDVSMETIRKDLNVLCLQGLAAKVYGGAIAGNAGLETRLELRTSHADRKSLIARAAVKLIRTQQSIILDAGSTCLGCVPSINTLSGKDVFTVSPEAAIQLNAEANQTFVLPGRKRARNHSVAGPWTEKFLHTIHADVCLLGTSGLKSLHGPTSHSYVELSGKKAMIEQSDLVYLLADSSKFLEEGLHQVCDWSGIDVIITDDGLSDAVYEKLKDKVQILFASQILEDE